MFIVHVHCSLFMFIVHCSHGATLIFDDLFYFQCQILFLGTRSCGLRLPDVEVEAAKISKEKGKLLDKL